MTRSNVIMGLMVMAMVGTSAQAGHGEPPAHTPPSGGDISGSIEVCGMVKPGVAYLDGHSYYAKTSSGSFILHQVPRGTYSLVVEVAGYAPAAFPVTLKRKDLSVQAAFCPDADGDGYNAITDCNDANPAVHPYANEACDGIDNDCDDQVDEGCPSCTVGDPCGDVPNGVGVCRKGTFDQNCNCINMVGPSTEICDGKDNDCDGTTDEGIATSLCPNQAGVCGGSRTMCYQGQLLDCNTVNILNPDYEEVEMRCDGLDNDCDGDMDEGCCPSGMVNCAGTCVDTSTNPQYCGSCTTACPSGAACTAGICTIAGCPVGLTNCAGTCVDTSTNAQYCGSCTTACQSGQQCNAGICQ